MDSVKLIGKWARLVSLGALLSFFLLMPAMVHASTISQVPLFLTQAVPPMVLFNMSNDHQLYFEAYPDYADLDGDGAANKTYTHHIDYYGYFDSYKCYTYSGGVFQPASMTPDKYCGGGLWSGNFLNWVSMSRIDVVRKILYGGLRSTDTSTQTILERSYLPNDAHSWVKFYDGNDIAQLTPFSLPETTVATSNSSHPLTTTAPVSADNPNKQFVTTFGANQVEVGDQLILRDAANPNANYMYGVVTHIPSAGTIRVQVSRVVGAEGTTINSWRIENPTRRGVSFCNTTVGTGFSQNVTAPPLIRVASGNYSLWTSNERWQCRWANEQYNTGHASMAIGGIRFSNGNDVGRTGLFANADNPRRDVFGLGSIDYVARVAACVPGLVGEERCKQYPAGNLKPIGLLQQFGDEDRIHFGLFTGSYLRNKSGGVLRRNIGSIANEVAVSTDGRFLTPPDEGSIIRTLNLLRVYGYNHTDGTYNSSSAGGDNCSWGLTNFNEGRCSNWGNPQSEMFLESLRYLSNAGGLTPNFGFSTTIDDRIPGLRTTGWQVPLNEENYCAAINLINFNASVSSYDHDQFDGVADLPGAGSVQTLTDIVGAGEGIHGREWFVGESGGNNNQLCTPKQVNSLGGVRGLCPEAPRLQGSYHMAGLAHWAWTNDIRPDLPSSQHVRTFGVALAPAVPRIDIPRPGQVAPAVTLLPACRNANGSNCAIVDFRIVHQDIDAGTGSFFIQWEDSEQGGDYDMDMNGILSYVIDDHEIRITTNIFAESTSQALGFGYVISGTNRDGFHVHSGTNNFTYNPVGYYVDAYGGEARCVSCNVGDPPMTVAYTLGGSVANLLESPLYYAAKWGGFDKDVGGFPANAASWDSTGDGKPDNYYFAIDPGKLARDLEEVFNQVDIQVSSAAAIATNSTRLNEDTMIYQARFNPEFWSGELLAFKADEGDGAVQDTPVWNAAERIPHHTQRTIITANPPAGTSLVSEGGRMFEWSLLDPVSQQAPLGNEDVFHYIRGDRSGEISNGGSFRNRAGVLGDIINSDPAFMGREDFGYGNATDDVAAAYRTFVQSKSNRRNVLFVGANAGKMHAFDAETGDELFAYVPMAVYPNLAQLASPDYLHRYYVDGSPRVADAYLNGQWRSLVIGSTGAGGRSVFVLDVTNPEPTSINGNNVIWEFTHAEMGYSIPQPSIARMADGHFWAIIPNGYNSPGGQARLFLKRIHDGHLVQINTGIGDGNGLSAAIPVDTTGNRTTNYIYAGDLKGNLWRFDVSGNINSWNNTNNRRVIFQARDADNRPQPITARPEVGRHPDGGYMIYFGTGAFFRVGDNVVHESDVRHSFYGVHDTGSATTITRTSLTRQEIIYEGNQFNTDVRVVSAANAAPNSRGWYLDLITPPNVFKGERVVSRAQLRFGRIIFVTLIPSQNPCEFGGDSWLMELDAITGQRLGYSVFDLNEDRDFDSSDYVTIIIDGEEINVPVSGMRPGVGIIKDPTIISAGDEREYKYVSGTSGEIGIIEERGGSDRLGRQSWRQLR